MADTDSSDIRSQASITLCRINSCRRFSGGRIEFASVGMLLGREAGSLAEKIIAAERRNFYREAAACQETVLFKSKDHLFIPNRSRRNDPRPGRSLRGPSRAAKQFAAGYDAH